MSHLRAQQDTLPRRPTLRRAVLRRVLQSWPFLVWVGVIFLAIETYQAGIAFKRMNGVVLPTPLGTMATAGTRGGAASVGSGAYPDAVAPVETAILREVIVQEGAEVRRGDVVARMDTSPIDSEIEDLRERQAEERVQLLQRLRSDLLSIEDERRRLRLDSASDEAEFARVRAVLDQLETMLAKRLPVEELVQQMQIAAAPIAARLELYPRLKEELDRSAGAIQASVEDVSAALSEIDQRESNAMELLGRQREMMTLRAPRDGIVYRVEHQVGEVVSAGDAVVRIVARPEEIVAFLPQEQSGRIAVGMPVWISSTADRRTFFPSRVTLKPPQIWNVTDPTSPLQNKRLHGMKVHIELPQGAELLPGQTVVVHLERPGRIPIFDSLAERFFPQSPPVREMSLGSIGAASMNPR